MNKILSIAAFVLVLIAGCGKKSQTIPQSPSGVILELGKGAVLISFPKTDDFTREDWLAIAHLDGPSDTQSLPRIPFADVQSLLVLNIEPGAYTVSAQAWMRKSSPSTGGILPGVDVVAGRVTILRAQRLPGIVSPVPTVPLIPAGNETWILQSGEKLPQYVARLVEDADKG